MTAVDRLRSLLGLANVIVAPGDMDPYLRDERGRFKGNARAVIRPGTVEEVAASVAICAADGIPVVPQGGNTGLVGASVPFERGHEILMNLSRLNRIRAIDPLNHTMTVEAGTILANVQAAALGANRLFPLSLGAEGTAQIGGLIGANAGGINVLRYGTMRDLVLGLEVVLPDGRVWNGLRSLRKNNTGYDLKHLFIGSEGTLGIVTAAVLKLFPRPQQAETAFVAVPDPKAAIDLLAALKSATGDAVSSFELISRRSLEYAVRHIEGVRDPLAEPSPWYILAEVTAGTRTEAFKTVFEDALAAALENGLAADATIAASDAQAQELWRIREAIVAAQKFEGGSIKNDVSVPVSRLPQFLDEALRAVEKACPGIRPTPFGHVGDGNIHFNLSQPEGMDKAAFMDLWDELTGVVNAVALTLGGSISAEHGIGRVKRDLMPSIMPTVEMEMMQGIKRLIDPRNLMNPGKLLP
jgi:FAD/FMN-containing dehydrogenase